jgi:hypothetical protein
MADRNLINEIKTLKQDAHWYDHGSPSARRKRERIAEEFEFVIQDHYGVTGDQEIWKKETFTEYCLFYLSIKANQEGARIGERVKVGLSSVIQHLLTVPIGAYPVGSQGRSDMVGRPSYS